MTKLRFTFTALLLVLYAGNPVHPQESGSSGSSGILETIPGPQEFSKQNKENFNTKEFPAEELKLFFSEKNTWNPADHNAFFERKAALAEILPEGRYTFGDQCPLEKGEGPELYQGMPVFRLYITCLGDEYRNRFSIAVITEADRPAASFLGAMKKGRLLKGTLRLAGSGMTLKGPFAYWQVHQLEYRNPWLYLMQKHFFDKNESEYFHPSRVSAVLPDLIAVYNSGGYSESDLPVFQEMIKPGQVYHFGSQCPFRFTAEPVRLTGDRRFSAEGVLECFQGKPAGEVRLLLTEPQFYSLRLDNSAQYGRRYSVSLKLSRILLQEGQLFLYWDSIIEITPVN